MLMASTAIAVVLANVGNVNGACVEAKFKLCQPAVEARAATALQATKADVLGLIEVLPGSGQARRLVGKGYAIHCDSRYGWDCLAVRKGSGLRLVGRLRTRPATDGCDDGFTVNTGTLRAGKRRIAVALAHPDSSGSAPACRAAQIEDLADVLPPTGKALVLGDFNVDPYRESDASVTAFGALRRSLDLRLASGRAFSLLPGTSMQDPTGEVLDDGTVIAGPPLGKRTLDHVLVRGYAGSCRVRRVDGGGGMDHRAQVCRLKAR